VNRRSRAAWSWGRRALHLAGPILLIVLVWRIGLAPLRDVWSKAQPSWLIAAAFLNLALLQLKSWRWRLLVRRQGIDLPAIPAWRHYAIGSALGAWTPGRLGDFSKSIALQRRTGMGAARALASVLADRILDAVALAVVAVLGVLSAGALAPGAGMMTGILAVVLMAAIALGAWLAPRAAARARWLPASIREACHDLAAMTTRDMGAVSGVTVMTLALTMTQGWLVARGTGLPAGFLPLCGALAIASLTSLAPISIGGLGTREAVMAAVLAPSGAALADVVGFSLAHAAIISGSLAVIGAAAWLLLPEGGGRAESRYLRMPPSVGG